MLFQLIIFNISVIFSFFEINSRVAKFLENESILSLLITLQRNLEKLLIIFNLDLFFIVSDIYSLEDIYLLYVKISHLIESKKIAIELLNLSLEIVFINEGITLIIIFSKSGKSLNKSLNSGFKLTSFIYCFNSCSLFVVQISYNVHKDDSKIEKSILIFHLSISNHSFS
jgi:hypothetical protein